MEQQVCTRTEQNLIGQRSRVHSNGENPGCDASLNTQWRILHHNEVVGL